MIEIIFSVASFLTYIFKSSSKKSFEKLLGKIPKILKEEKIILKFNRCKFAYYLDFHDLISGKVEDMTLIVDQV